MASLIEANVDDRGWISMESRAVLGGFPPYETDVADAVEIQPFGFVSITRQSSGAIRGVPCPQFMLRLPWAVGPAERETRDREL